MVHFELSDQAVSLMVIILLNVGNRHADRDSIVVKRNAVQRRFEIQPLNIFSCFFGNLYGCKAAKTKEAIYRPKKCLI